MKRKLLKNDDGDGSILLSRRKGWKSVSTGMKSVKAYEDKSFVTVKVIRQVNGGVIAAYKEVIRIYSAFPAFRQYVENADEFIGQDY